MYTYVYSYLQPHCGMRNSAKFVRVPYSYTPSPYQGTELSTYNIRTVEAPIMSWVWREGRPSIVATSSMELSLIPCTYILYIPTLVGTLPNLSVPLFLSFSLSRVSEANIL